MRTIRALRALTPQEQKYALELMETYDSTIRRVACRYLGSDYRSELEDVVQDTYESICLQLEDFRTYDSPEALVTTITARGAWRTRRKLKLLTPLSDDHPALEDGNRGLEEVLPAGTSDVDRDVLTRIFVRRDTAEEAAADLGTSVETLRQRTKRARDRLRKRLE